MSALEEAFKLIEDNADRADFEGPKAETLVSHAERELHLVFPPTYRKFLQNYGCGDIAGFEVYGLITDKFENSTVPNGIWLTLNQRKTSGLPSELILIAETGEGSYYAINTLRKTSDSECPVVEWDPGDPQDLFALPIIAEDFGDFLLKEITVAVS